MKRREFLGASGGAAAWPVAARAQQSVMPVIGFMSARSPENSVQALAQFKKGLGEGGFFDGRNVTVEYRWARGDYGRLPMLVDELAKRRVSVLAAVGGDASARAAQAAASSLPVVLPWAAIQSRPVWFKASTGLAAT